MPYFELLPYPIDMFPWLKLASVVGTNGRPLPSSFPECGSGIAPTISNGLHAQDVYSRGDPLWSPVGRPTYDPTYIAQYALAQWNAFLVTEDNEHKEAFMAQAHWLLTHEWLLSSGAGGWPIYNHNASHPCLSALTQGNVISVLVRAYQLTREDIFLHAAQRAVRTFEMDILDGGVNTPIGNTGIFFEEIAVYPAAHFLKGYLLALFGLYDYVTLTKESKVEALIQRSVAALHSLINEFDTGYWTYSNLLHKRLTSRSEHALHVRLLKAFAECSGCIHCAALASHWDGYQRRLGPQLRYLVASRLYAYWDNRLKPMLRHHGLQNVNVHSNTSWKRVCVPITAFPVPGGMRGVLNGVAQVMGKQWQMTYLTHHKGQGAEGLVIETFGRRIASPWQFPGVWLYCLSGCSRLLNMLRSGSGYDLILPQDGVFTAAFAALLGKMAGIRVVCMDHGNVTLLDNPSFRRECLEALQTHAWPKRVLLSLLLDCYWPSQRVLARVATQCVDQFLVAGDEVEEVYRKSLGVHPSRILRYAYMIDVARFPPLDREARIRMRAEQEIAEDSIVITLINRLAAEKGLHFALEGIALALSTLSSDIRSRVKVLIVGDGPLRSHVEADIRRHCLDAVCVLWGEAKPSDVVMLLGISDVFLYSGTRGTNYSVAVLEAMAAGCAVVASVVPQSNARLLAEGRGIAVTPTSAAEISMALIRLSCDMDLCREMGQMARKYVATYHSPLVLKRDLLRASFFMPSLEDIRSPSARQSMSSG